MKLIKFLEDNILKKYLIVDKVRQQTTKIYDKLFLYYKRGNENEPQQRRKGNTKRKS